MKLPKILLLVLFSLQICLGQNQNESVLVDEFGKLPNDELQGRVFNFKNTLGNDNSRGLIVLYGKKENPLAGYINERRIQGCISYLKYDAARFSFIFAENKNEILGQFWKIPKGAKKPEIAELPHDYKIANLSKPYLIYRFNEYIADEFCPLFFNMEFYSRFLKANSDLLGKIVIHEKTVVKFQKEKLKYFRELTKKENVEPQQIEFVKGKYTGVSDTEFWLVPLKKNR